MGGPSIAVPWRVDPARAAQRDDLASKFFAYAAVIAVLFFQKFGILIGPLSAFFICLPIFLGLLAWIYWIGLADIRPTILIAYSVTLALMLTATAFALIMPDNRVGFSLTSLVGIIVVYLICLLKPNGRFNTGHVFPAFLVSMRIICAVAIIQYFAQYVGVRFSTIEDVVGALRPLLVERAFATAPVIAYGSPILRANGFFILEPSILSQLVMFVLVVDFFLFRRIRWIPLYGIAYLVTYSGTGILCLALAICIYSCIEWKKIGQTAFFIIVGVVAMIGASIAFPSQFGSIAGRSNELQSEGSSGYARYTSQFETIGNVLLEPRSLVGFGPGAMARSPFYTEGSGSSQLQMLIDYGLGGLIAFFGFFFLSLWRKEMKLLSVLCWVTYVLGGGYLLFAPMLILMVLLCTWSLPHTESPRPQASSAPRNVR